MKHAIFCLSCVLLALWTIGCAGAAVWYYPQAMQASRMLVEAWQGLQAAQEDAAAGIADPAAAAGYVVWLWFFAVALAWNIVATPLGIIALIAKPD